MIFHGHRKWSQYDGHSDVLSSIIVSWVEEPNKIFSPRLWWENMVCDEKKVLIKVALKLDYISRSWMSMHLDNHQKDKNLALFLEQLMSQKTFSIVGRRKQWNERWEVRLCRELWIGQTSVVVSLMWTCNHTLLLSKKCLSGKTWLAVHFALYAQRNTEVWWTDEVSLPSLFCLNLSVWCTQFIMFMLIVTSS